MLEFSASPCAISDGRGAEPVPRRPARCCPQLLVNERLGTRLASSQQSALQRLGSLAEGEAGDVLGGAVRQDRFDGGQPPFSARSVVDRPSGFQILSIEVVEAHMRGHLLIGRASADHSAITTASGS